MDYKKAGLSYTMGSFFNKGIGFFTVPVFTRLLSTSDYGIVSTYNSWVSMVSVIIGMAFYMALRQAYIEFPEKIDDYHSTITIFITIVSTAWFLLCIWIGCAISIDVLLPVLCIIQSYASALIENYSMYLMMEYRYKMRTVFMVLPNLISIIIATVMIMFVLDKRLYLGRAIPTAFITFIFGLIVIVVVFRRSHTFNKDYLKYSLAISVPLIAHGVALTILSQSDRMMIATLAGVDKAGIYSVVYNFSMIATALSTALSGIWQPWYLTRLKSHSDEDFSKINKITKDYVLFISMVMCAVILTAPEVLKFLASEPYWDGISIIPPIVLANLVIFIYTIYVDVEHFHKKTKAIAVNTLIAAGCNIILNYIFIPLCGYEAAAYTTIASYAISLLMHYIQSKKLEPKIAKLVVYARGGLMVAIVSVIYYSSINFWIIRWGATLILIGIVMLYLFKRYKHLLRNVEIVE